MDSVYKQIFLCSASEASSRRRRVSRSETFISIQDYTKHIRTYTKAHTSKGFTATTVSLNHYLLSNNESTTLVVLFCVSTYDFGHTPSAYICCWSCIAKSNRLSSHLYTSIHKCTCFNSRYTTSKCIWSWIFYLIV